MEFPAQGIPGSRSFGQRMVGAAMLDVSVYEEVEHDRGATGQAAGVVAIVAVCALIGSWNLGLWGIVGAVIMAFIGWLIIAAATYVIGTKVFGGTADFGEMLRTLGFSRAPGVLLILGFIPFLGWLVAVAVWVWQLVTAVVAIRQALDFDTAKAILTGVLASIVVWLLGIVYMIVAAGTHAAVRAVT